MKPKPTVLFIDDDPTMRKVYTVGLAMAGLPTLIVTDLMMPGFNGVDLIKAVREADYTKHIPILVFTSGGNMDMIEQAALAGATEVLQKHNTPPAKLIERILKIHADAPERK